MAADDTRTPADSHHGRDPLAETPWSTPGTVAGFSSSPPNPVLIEIAKRALRPDASRLLDVGCGAGRNAVPLARAGWDVVGVDLSRAMLDAAAARARAGGEQLQSRLRLALAAMDAIPARDRSFDFIVAHGIWNLARSSGEFRRAVAEGARVARPGSAVFVFTFSRHTLPADARPIPGETFIFTQFSGQPQCFLTAEQLVEELDTAGFSLDPAVPFRELNLPQAGALRTGRVPVIHEGLFRAR